jgi:hypothetical protein
MSLKDVCNYRSNENIPIDTLLNVLRREETLRLCPELQILYDSCGSHSPPSEIESEIQRIALLENGYCCCWLGEYWNTSIRYPYNSSRIASTVRNTTVWLRHFERFIDDEDVQTQVGHFVPDVPLLYTGDCMKKTSLHHFIKRNQPLVVVAGSGS